MDHSTFNFDEEFINPLFEFYSDQQITDLKREIPAYLKPEIAYNTTQQLLSSKPKFAYLETPNN